MDTHTHDRHGLIAAFLALNIYHHSKTATHPLFDKTNGEQLARQTQKYNQPPRGRFLYSILMCKQEGERAERQRERRVGTSCYQHMICTLHANETRETAEKRIAQCRNWIFTCAAYKNSPWCAGTQKPPQCPPTWQQNQLIFRATKHQTSRTGVADVLSVATCTKCYIVSSTKM